jgi:crotonobetainyl-CoA:carnitine CoA-transferase CaiB-like acyl-CoA transferase
MATATQGEIPVNDWGPLAGIKVLDFTLMLAGPYGTQVLADLGATVIKVEAPGQGDSTRHGGPFHPGDQQKRHAGYFHSVNRNKRSIVIDLKSEAGRQAIFDLIPYVDVVTENFRAGTMEKLGVSYEELNERNPGLIYAAVRGFGDPRTGASPYQNWPAYDVVAQAMGGIAGITGPDAETPTKIGPGVGDIVPGMFMAIGILSALVSRAKTGRGQFLDVSMLDAVLALTERIVWQHSFAKLNPGPIGNHHPNIAPFGFFPTKDGSVAIGATFQHFFNPLCVGIEAPELLSDPRFLDEDGRRRNRVELIEELGKRTNKFTKAELTVRLGGKVPYGPVYTVEEIAADPHFAARNMLPELDIDGIPEPVSVAGIPVKLAGTPGQVLTAGPELGADTDAMLGAIGYSSERLAKLREQGVIG